MKTRTKALLLAMCAVLLVVTTVMATLAFLTSQTEVVKNTFTVGNVKITLDEADVDNSTADKDRDTENEYHLLPNKEYDKDPTVHVKANSENCYIFVTVTNDIVNIEKAGNTTIAAQMAANGWTPIADGSNTFYYNGTANGVVNGVVEKNSAVQDFVVFKTFTINGDVDNDTLATYVTNDAKTTNLITVVGYAVQAQGFNSAVEAWNATFGAPQNP